MSLKRRHQERKRGWFEIAFLIIVLALIIYIILSPATNFSRTQRLLLYALTSFFAAILFTSEADTRFELDLKIYVFATSGALAAFAGIMVLLNSFETGQKTTVFEILKRDQQPYQIRTDNPKVGVWSANNGILKPDYLFIENNKIIVVTESTINSLPIKLGINDSQPPLCGILEITGSKTLTLYKDLTIEQCTSKKFEKLSAR